MPWGVETGGCEQAGSSPRLLGPGSQYLVRWEVVVVVDAKRTLELRPLLLRPPLQLLKLPSVD